MYQLHSSDIICLVVAVQLCVCLVLWHLHCAPLQWYIAMLCTIVLHFAPLTCIVHHFDWMTVNYCNFQGGFKANMLRWCTRARTQSIYDTLVVHNTPCRALCYCTVSLPLHNAKSPFV